MRLCRVQRASGLVEELEVRLLPAVVVPTVAETYLVELINRARANPAAEAMRLGLALGEGEGRVALPPLAINGLLEDAAVNHANWMLLNQTTSHVETPNSPLFTGAEVVARMADAGYTDANRAGESLLVQGVRGDLTNFPDYAQIAYQAFFRDAGGTGEPDRQTMLDATVREIGVGIRSRGPRRLC